MLQQLRRFQGTSLPPQHAERLRALQRLPWHLLAPIAVFAVLSLLGVTLTSIGIGSLREDPSNPEGFMVGHADTIRSDEFLTALPLSIGVTVTGVTDDLNPLTAQTGFLLQVPSGPVSSLVLLDGTLLRLGPAVPDEMLIATRFWLPFLLLVLATPAFYASLSGNRAIGYFAALLVALSPASAWWSFGPMAIVAFTVAGCAALQKASRALQLRQTSLALAWAFGSALLLARAPLTYQPWAIMLVPSLVLVTVVGIAASSTHKMRGLLAVGVTGLASLLLLAGTLLENSATVKAALGTVYPGQRVATGAPNPFQEVFGATQLASLKDYVTFVGTNASEISSSFAICFVWAALLIARGLVYHDRGHRAATYVMAGVSAFWLAWATVDFGSLGARLPIINMVPAFRAADFVGFLAVLLICLVLPGSRARSSLSQSAFVAGTTALVAAYAGSLIQKNLPEVSTTDVWQAGVVVAGVVFLITLLPQRGIGYVVAGLLLVLPVWKVNPVIIGLGDLRDSDVADRMLDAGIWARERGELWVSDSAAVDALMMATGVPSLSGRQISGPDREAWRRILPDGTAEAVWNRGGSYIWFGWNSEDSIALSNPGEDVIHIVASPCALAEAEPRLTRVVTSAEFALPCLREVGQFDWGGAPRWIYAVNQ